MCRDCYGRDSSDSWQDLVLTLPNRSEFMARLMEAANAAHAASAAGSGKGKKRKQSAAAGAAAAASGGDAGTVGYTTLAEIPSALRAGETLKTDIQNEFLCRGVRTATKEGTVQQDTYQVQFVRDTTLADLETRFSSSAGHLRVTTAGGIPADLETRLRKAAAKRAKKRKERELREAEQRRQADAERAAIREQERLERIKQRKAQRAADRAARDDAARQKAEASAAAAAKRMSQRSGGTQPVAGVTKRETSA
jgi:hypothetical protein